MLLVASHKVSSVGSLVRYQVTRQTQKPQVNLLHILDLGPLGLGNLVLNFPRYKEEFCVYLPFSIDNTPSRFGFDE